MISKNKRLIYARDSNGASIVHIAAKEGHLDIIKYLTTENAESTKITDNVRKFQFILYVKISLNNIKSRMFENLSH